MTDSARIAAIHDLTPADVAQIIEGIEHFIITGDEDVDEIWRPYIDKLERLSARLLALEAPQAQEKYKAALDARRKHQGELMELAHRLYRRFGKADEDVMNLWSLVVIDPEPLTEAEIARTHELFPELVPPMCDHDDAPPLTVPPSLTAPYPLRLPVIDIEHLDAGIQQIVLRLRAEGFETTDSGDGVSKPASPEVLPYRHVFCRVETQAASAEADRLQGVLGKYWAVEASYSALDHLSVLIARELEPPRYEGIPPVNWASMHPAVRGVELHWWDQQGVRSRFVHRPSEV